MLIVVKVGVQGGIAPEGDILCVMLLAVRVYTPAQGQAAGAHQVERGAQIITIYRTVGPDAVQGYPAGTGVNGQVVVFVVQVR